MLLAGVTTLRLYLSGTRLRTDQKPGFQYSMVVEQVKDYSKDSGAVSVGPFNSSFSKICWGILFSNYIARV